MRASILDELRDQGIRPEARSNGNLYVTPKARLTPDLLDRIRRHKLELLALLEQKRLPFAQLEARCLFVRAKSTESVYVSSRMGRWLWLRMVARGAR
jgi:hypothetical protein